MLSGRPVRVSAHGNTHPPTIRRVEAAFPINPGTISECWNFTARGADPLYSPWAALVALDWSNSPLRLNLHRANIDVNAVIRGAAPSGRTGAAEWIALWRQGHNGAPYLG